MRTSEASASVSLSDRMPVPNAKTRDIKHPVQKEAAVFACDGESRLKRGVL